jgi:hypothetical protein
MKSIRYATPLYVNHVGLEFPGPAGCSSPKVDRPEFACLGAKRGGEIEALKLQDICQEERKSLCSPQHLTATANAAYAAGSVSQAFTCVKRCFTMAR